MVAGRRGFALILVLVATSLVFALGMRATANARSATVEASALRRAHEMERVARSAALVAIAAIAGQAAPVEDVREPNILGGGDGGPGEAAVEGRQIPEMPPAMRELLGHLGEGEGEGQEEQEALAPTQQQQPRRARPRGLLEALRAGGLSGDGMEVEALGRRVHVRMVDAAGLLNVNHASATEMTRLLLRVGVDRARAERIGDELVDYRDSDDFVSPKGSESESYAVRNLRIANAELKALEEMLFLPSMTRDVFDAVSEHLTSVGSGLVHVATAPREVLESLDGMTAEAAQRLVAARQAGEITGETIEATLSPLSEGVAGRLTSRVSGFVRCFVTPVDARGPAIRVDLAIDGAGGVRFVYVGAE